MLSNISILNRYKNSFNELVRFIKFPDLRAEDQLGKSAKISGTWRIFVIKMALTIVISLIVGAMYDPVNKTSSRMSEEFSPLMLIMIGVLILPTLEEIAFRLSLRFKPIFLSLTLAVFAYYIATKGIFQTNLSNSHESFETRVLIALASLLISYPVFRITSISALLERFWNINFKWVLYLTCLSFALVHSFNYDLTSTVMLLLPFILLPKLIAAFCYSLIRVRYGFIYSLILHMSWNFIGIVMSLLDKVD